MTISRAKKMIKIAYFDEGSATDLLYVLAGGKNTNKKQDIVTKTSELAIGAEAEANKAVGVLSMFSAKMGAAGNADLSREGNTIITKALENTILTDYLSCSEKKGKKYINLFLTYKQKIILFYLS